MNVINEQQNNVGIVKDKLKSYGILQRKIDHQITRLENHVETIDMLASTNYSGMPHGSHNRISRTERYVEKKEELEIKIDEMIQEEKNLRKEIESMISMLDDPDEQALLEMRYIDVLNWEDIFQALYGMLDDYEDNPERYEKRTYRVHGTALQRLAHLYKQNS